MFHHFNYGVDAYVAIRGKVLVQHEMPKELIQVQGINLLQRFARDKPDQHCQDALDYAGVAVAMETDQGAVDRVRVGSDPDLAHALLDLVVIGLEGLGHRGQLLAQLDQEPVTLILVAQ